jgi:hypothetical protein
MSIAVEDDASGRRRGAHFHRLAQGQSLQFTSSNHLQPGVDQAKTQHHQPNGHLKDRQSFVQEIPLA